MKRLRETVRVWLALGLRRPRNVAVLVAALAAGGVAVADPRALLGLLVLALVVAVRPDWFRPDPQDVATWRHPADVRRVVVVTRFEDVDGVPSVVASSHDGRYVYPLEAQR